MTRPCTARLPWEPLGQVIAGIELDRMPVGDSPKLIGRLLGVDSRYLVRIRCTGLTFTMADRFCQIIERHPAEIWAEWCDVADLAAAS